MRRIFLPATTLLTAAVFNAPASAAPELDLDLSAFFVGAIGYVDDDDLTPGPDGFAAGSDSEVHVTGSFSLDNGLAIGFHAEAKIEGDSASQYSDYIEEAFVSVDGFFGRFELGGQDGVADQMAVTSPTLFRGNTVNDNELDFTEINWINTVATINHGRDDFSAKIIYLTPRIAGFQAGVSFAPKVTTDDSLRAPCGSVFCATDETDYENLLEAGLTYFKDFSNDVSLGVSTTYLTADDDDSSPAITEDPKAWAVGVNIGYSGFVIGGSFKESENIRGNRVEYQAWDIGSTYQTGPWEFMLAYAEDEYELSGSTLLETSAVQGGVDFELGKYVSIGGGVQYVQTDSPVADADETVVFIETMISF